MDLLCPLFFEVALTFILLFSMGYARYRAVSSGDVRVRDIALRQQNWTERPTKIANAFHNQLETPILFYLLVVLALITSKSTDMLVILAWVYVALRFVHAFIHVTYNKVLHRFIVFVASVIILAIMWVSFALSLYT